MRTTLTLDDDVATGLKAEVRKSGKPFKQVVNDTIRNGLTRPRRKKLARFKVKARPMGLYPHLNYDRISELIEIAEGPLHR